MKVTAKAYTNIALIKYWGKRDEKLHLPMNGSISITLDGFSSTTTVDFLPDYAQDSFVLNENKATEEETSRVIRFLDIIRSRAGKNSYASVVSTNDVPTAAGFASSASGFAALAAAAVKSIGLVLERRELSVIARQGSGSACRSIYGGFVEWRKGENAQGTDSYAIPLLAENEWELSILSVSVALKRKIVSSRAGMKRTVETSPLYSGWLDSIDQDLQSAREAIQRRDFEWLGNLAERNALKMHAVALGADPPVLYWQSATLDVIALVQGLRASGVQAYFTIDAGPNVKVLCPRKDEQEVYTALSSLPDVRNVQICHPGPGVQDD